MTDQQTPQDHTPNANERVNVEVDDGYAVLGRHDNPIIHALISGEPLPQERAERAEDERRRARGEIAFTPFNDLIPGISRAELLGGGEHELGLIHNFILEHWRDQGNPLNMAVERQPQALLVLDNGDSYLRAIEIMVKAAGTGAQVRVDCAGGIYLGDDERSAQRYRAAAELARALGDYLTSLDRMGQSSQASETQELKPVKRWRGTGQPPKTKAEKLAAIEAWDSIPDYDRIPLEDWLEANFGLDPANGLAVQVQTFHGWRRYKKS